MLRVLGECYPPTMWYEGGGVGGGGGGGGSTNGTRVFHGKFAWLLREFYPPQRPPDVQVVMPTPDPMPGMHLSVAAVSQNLTDVVADYFVHSYERGQLIDFTHPVGKSVTSIISRVSLRTVNTKTADHR